MSAGTQPTLSADHARELLDTFARGWSKAQPDLILRVFDTDATFLETPFAEPLAGSDAIRKYWSDVPYNQSEITVTTGEIFLVGPWFAAEFKTVFRRRRTGEWVVARGALFCETDGVRITEMRMYWHRRADSPG
jgi:ketosteroid isomerase-like protein